MPRIRTASRSATACSTGRGSPFPRSVPVGTYTAETFLIHDGRVIAAAAREIEIDKSGFERFVADGRRALGRSPTAWPRSLLSLLLGWAASAVFRRRYLTGFPQSSKPILTRLG